MLARQVTFFVVIVIVIVGDLLLGVLVANWLPMALMPFWAMIVVGAMHFLTPPRLLGVFNSRDYR